MIQQMIYASDFSFTERAIIDVWVWLWFIQRVWSTDKFASLRWSKLRNFDLKSVITLLIFLMLPVQAVFDVIWSYLKYSEGTKAPFRIEDKIIIDQWSPEHILLKNVTEYVLACGFAFQIGTLALMQAFWSHLSSQMGGKPFMRSWKFRFYVGWVFASMVIFPLARFLSSHDFVLSENIPQFIFSLKLFVISLLGIKNGMRLNDLLSSIQQQSSPRGQETIVRIHYFIEMNRLLSLGAFLISVGISSITIDAIFRVDRINQSKFWMDFFIIHANFGSLMLWGTMILIIYPRYYLIGLSDIAADRLSSEFEQSKIKHSTPSYVVDLNGTPHRASSKAAITPITTTISTSPTMTSDTMTPLVMTPTMMTPTITTPRKISGSFGYKVEQSVSNILEQQAERIETYRHKTSMSISSTITPPSPSTPLTPLTPLTPPDTNGLSD